MGICLRVSTPRTIWSEAIAPEFCGTHTYDHINDQDDQIRPDNPCREGRFTGVNHATQTKGRAPGS